jgi:hypothetical protein
VPSRLYISSSNFQDKLPTVSVYDVAASGNAPPLRTITGVGGPIALDRDGNLYLFGQDGINIYGQNAQGDGNAIPHNSLANGATGAALAVDSLGKVYVLNRLDEAPDGAMIQIYIPGPPAGDGQLPGNFVLNQTLTVFTGGGGNFAGIAVDPLDNLYVFENLPGLIRVYQPPFSDTPSPVGTLPFQPTDFPNSMDFDSNDKVYVGGSTDVVVLQRVGPGQYTPVGTIQGSSTDISRSFVSVSVDASGLVYAQSGSSVDDLLPQDPRVTVYDPGTTGNIPPVRTLTGIVSARSDVWIAVTKTFLPLPGTISGKVSDFEGNGLSGASLSFFSPVLSSFSGDTISLFSDPSGSYATPVVPAGAYGVSVTLAGFVSASANLTVDQSVIENFVLAKKGVLTGNVTDTAGNPLVGVTLNLGSVVSVAQTDINGLYSFSLNPGSYAGTVSLPSFTADTFSVAVPEGVTVTRDFMLVKPAAGVLTGIVTDDGSVPLLNVRVSAEGKTVSTDGNGSYTLPELFPGSVNVTVNGGLRFIVQHATVNVTPGATTEFDFALVGRSNL